jgi:hypothetical protein
MKAVLALIVVYVGTFFLVIQGASQNAVQVSAQNGKTAQDSAASSQANSIDPAKEADIRSLMELVGARDVLEEGATKSTEQYREALLASVPDNDRGQAFINTFLDAYQKKFNLDDVTNELVVVYNKHFSEDEIKGLLQFYGSPLGQKYAEEMPKVSAEAGAAGRAVSLRAARDVIQDLRKQYPGMVAQARLQKLRPGQQAQPKQQTQAQQSPSQP